MEEADDVLGLGLSPGFKLQPEDDELVEHFLLRQNLGQQLPLEGVILEDDPLSAPPWKLLDEHKRKDDAFFFANGHAIHDNSSRQGRTCVGGGCWEGQKVCVDGERLRGVQDGGAAITWKKYMLNFHHDGDKRSTGWVMHEYSITAPVGLASSPLRLYRIRFSGHGENSKREPDDYAQAKAERHLREQQASAANSAFPMVDLVDDEDQDYQHQHQLVNAMHNWPQQVDSFQDDFAVPNSGADFGDYAGPGTQQYFEDHASATNSVLEDPAATSYSEQDYQYPWPWVNQVGSCQNLGVVPSQDAYVGDYAGASSNQYFMGGNLVASDQGAPGVMDEYDGATPAAGIDEPFLDQDINIDDYLVYDQY